MKKGKILIYALLIVLITIFSCVARRTPSGNLASIKKYDGAAFDYVYAEALKQKLMGNPGDALRYLEECVKLNPESDAAYYQMAQIVLASGDIINGKKYAEKAYKIREDNIWYVIMLGQIYYRQGVIDSAIKVYVKAAVTFPGRQNILTGLAALYSENKDFQKAVDVYKRMESVYGINETTTPGLVQNLVYAKMYDEAFLKTEQLIAAFPAEIKFYALMAEVYREKGDGEKAREVYAKLLEENPDNGQIQLSVCDFLINENKFEELLPLLNTVILNAAISREDKISLFARLTENRKLEEEIRSNLLLSVMVLEAAYPNDDIIPLLRVEFLVNNNRKGEAIIRLEELINLRPANYYTWEKLLLLYLDEHDYNMLMIRGEEAASRFNRSFLAKVLYANGALENRKYSVAMEELRKAEILAGDNKVYLVQVVTMKADVYYRMGENNKAFETFEEALKLDGEDVTILNNYAYYLAEQNTNLGKAEEMARKVIEREKDNATFLDTYAWVLYKRGKVRDAAKIMEAILLKGSDGNAEYYEHYGYMLKSMKKCDKAVVNWLMAIELDSTKTDLNNEILNCTNK